ncbi:hypothetical protein INT44_006189 [Umbelopsis vinacea]|uniref:DNA endonuclease activator Ctp1 C-terminal domain-containing protein n=1 Tax=Umbelopsis vinacea TaxID=44442 RepID=A0A8H7PTQ5_9FUNG|nr:hypothetical protein INT44_006189 [Umbelopsis vinacea]
MTSDKTIQDLQIALKRERTEKRIYKTLIEQYKNDLEHRDRIIERLRAALSTRQLRPQTTPPPAYDEAPLDNSATYDKAYEEELSSRTSIDLNLEDDVVSSHQEEHQSSQDHTHARPSSPEYERLALPDVTTDVLSSVLFTTPQSKTNHNIELQKPVKAPRRPRATQGCGATYTYTEHPSPSLRAYDTETLGDVENMDLFQAQSMVCALNQQKLRPFEASQAASDENLQDTSEEYQEVDDNSYDEQDDGSQNECATTLSASSERSALLNSSSLNNDQTSPIHNRTATYMAGDGRVDENSNPSNRTHQDVSPQQEFAYVDVVRNRYERTKMHGTLPDVEEPDKVQHAADRIKKNSRHREVYKRPLTPPGYWDVEFPSSQEIKRLKQDGSKANTRKDI